MRGKKIKSYALKDKEIALYELNNGQFYVSAKTEDKPALNHKTTDLNIAFGIFDFWVKKVEGN